MNIAKTVPLADIDPTWLLRIFTIIPVVLILLAGAGTLWIYFFVLSLLPQGQSVVQIPGLVKDVRVVRDSNGVPGIIGEREDDVAVVLGYVMAQDRLWQMDFLRRAGQGRLAEVLGPDYLHSDQVMRTVRAGKQVPDDLNGIGPVERKWVDSFVRGINRYIMSHEGKLPVEFSLLEYRPRNFTAEDVSAIVAALAWESSRAVHIDPLMTRILGRLGPERALELFPTDASASKALVASDFGGWQPKGLLFGASGPGIRGIPGFMGGCAWAVGPDHTRSGKPMTACSVFQALTAPGFWYRARLVAQGFHLSGAFVPGVPVALAGSNEKVTFGAVPVPVDDADLYIEKLDSDEADAYWRVDRRRRFEVVRETYRIRGGPAVTHPVRLTDVGPLVSDVSNGLALSLRWTAREGLGFFSAFYALNRSKSPDDLQNALKGLVAPCMNVVWSDDEGHFGMQSAGKIPVRPPGSDGIVPLPAWTGVHDWMGYIPFDELPGEINPRDGYVVAADGRPGGSHYPFFSGCYWSRHGKEGRITQLIKQSHEHFRESFQGIQNDSLSPIAQDLVPVLLAALDKQPRKNRTEEEAARVLASWDYRMEGESAGAAVFALTYKSLMENVLAKPLGSDLYAEYAANPVLTSHMVRQILHGKKQLRLTALKADALLVEAFRDGTSLGKGFMGDHPSKWKWGEIHRVSFHHPLATRSRFLEALYDVGPLSLPGSFDTINFAGWSPAQAFGVRGGVSLRQVSDMTEPPQLYAVSPLGASAHFFSTHYKDQTSAWAHGRSFRDPTQTADIRKSGFDPVLFKAGAGGTISMNEP